MKLTKQSTFSSSNHILDSTDYTVEFNATGLSEGPTHKKGSKADTFVEDSSLGSY